MRTPTLTIGIPAHNEEGNIIALLESIRTQKHTHFLLKEIIIDCDGCTDNTVNLVREFATLHPQMRISVHDDKKRLGKALRLNEIYDKNTSDLLLTIDADVIFYSKDELDHMAKAIEENKEVLLVGPRYIPMKTHTLMGKFAEYSYLSFEDSILKLQNGNNIYALMGCCSMIKKELVDSFRYPKGLISDQNYLFMMARKSGENTFKLVKDAKILFMPVTTFNDWRLLGIRSVYEDKGSVVEYTSKDVLTTEYFMPRKLYIQSLIKWFFKHPLYTSGAFFMNVFIRVFPYKKHQSKNGIWEMTNSTKIGLL